MKKRNLIFSILAVLAIALGSIIYLNRVYLGDLISAAAYSAPEEIQSIENKLQLTDRASLTFAATHPSLESRDNFNYHCESYNQEISVLGCYTSGKIYIYNISSEDLNGVIESTAAHELLHAVWARLSTGEKNDLAKLLVEVYNDEKYHATLADDLETYDESDRIEELHSRIGTEIADLPAALETHYAKYFKNQDLIVDFYDSYIAPFQELSAEIDSLSAELEKLDEEIGEKTENYYSTAHALSAKIDEFNRCYAMDGCFASEAAFNSRRNTLMAEQSALDDLYTELNSLVNQYNSLVGEYNDNVLRSEVLEKAMNSNSEIEDLIK